MIEKAFAKINLHLEVLNKRDDGYHNLFSLMARIAIYDLLKLEFIDTTANKNFVSIKNITGTYSNIFDEIPDKDNLITRAAYLYLEKIQRKAHLEISIVKEIPAGAGLAGGSSDAAAILRLLNKHFQSFNQRELLLLAEQIGADVPFCLNQKLAFCEGTGNIIIPIEKKLSSWIVIANDGTHVNTGEAFSLLSRKTTDTFNTMTIKNTREIIYNNLCNNNIHHLQKIMKNDFEKVIFRKYPELEKLKYFMYEKEADFATMTGSGSTIIGLYASEKKAKETQLSLQNKVKLALVTKFT